MLVLKRNRNEELVIGKTIRVIVLETTAKYTLLGIEAPRDVLVLRKELACPDQRRSRGT